MTDGFVRGPGEGQRVSPAMTLKVGDAQSTVWSMFEVVDIGPGFDVGAHLHRKAEELFYAWRASSTCSPSNLVAERPATGRTGSLTAGPGWPAAGRGA